MQRSVRTVVGWSLVSLTLASCSTGTGSQTGSGGRAGTGGAAGNGQAGSGTGGSTAGTGGAGTGGSGGTGGGPAGTGGAAAEGGTSGSGGGAGGTAGTTGGAGGAAGATGGSRGGAGGAAGTTGGSGGGMGGQRPDASAPDAGGDATTDAGDGWMPLFNGRDLTGWIPSQGHTALYAASMLNGEPVIHVYPTQADQSNQPQATLRTTESFSRYTFHLEYKWGTKRFGDRRQSDRDNGICFHLCNDVAMVWPDSVEFQLGNQMVPQDWVSGHIFMLVERTRAQWTYTTLNGQRVYSPNGTRTMIGSPVYKAMTDRQREKPNNDWNVVEITVHGSTDATYYVNGEVANGLTNMECQVNGTWRPLDRGPIALQAEYSEIYFRNIKIKVLP
jgi:hypothetical protein